MGERTEYRPGTFCWTDLTTTDQEAAKEFYGGLFGWQAEDIPVGEGIVYSMMRLDGRDVAAISPQPEELREIGAPPTWNSYVSVADADAAAARAEELGAELQGEPFDVFDSGRMVVMRDPHGASVFVWEPRDHAGARLVNGAGALSWNELATPDLDGSATFYRELFGWTTEPLPDSPQPYLMIRNGDANNGGMREIDPPGMPPYWLVYFGSDDVGAGLNRVDELGGVVLAGPIDIQMGSVGVAQDPQGGVFALYAGEFEP